MRTRYTNKRTTRIDDTTTASMVYVGKAALTGSEVATSSAVWQIVRIDTEKTGTYVYVSYTETGGAWYIYRRIIASNTRQYATGATDYATNWTNRGSQTYV